MFNIGDTTYSNWIDLFNRVARVSGMLSGKLKETGQPQNVHVYTKRMCWIWEIRAL